MPQKIFRKYGVSTTIDFTLSDPTGIDIITTAVHVSGDTNISIDGAAEKVTVNGFINVDQGYRITLEASEMIGKSIRVPTVDQTASKIWKDETLIIETYGHIDAQHQIPDLLTLIDGVTVEHINELLMAMVNGQFEKNVPADGDITFFKRDNTTPLTVIHVDEDDGIRTRISP